MKIFSRAFQVAALAAVVSTPAFADRNTEETFDLNSAFGGDAPVVERLDTQAMEETRGRMPLLAIPLAIAGVDIGLMGLFWGIYVPNYSYGGNCTGCYQIN
ncbi:MAG: hypothetical protein ABR612_00445 [Chromatocurvus sp.]